MLRMAGAGPAVALAPARRGRFLAVLGAGAAVLLGIGAWYLTRGNPSVGLGEVGAVLLGGQGSVAPDTELLVRELRLPRLLLAVVAGASLALAGVLMQDSLRNPIADPGLLGIAQSASLVVALALFFPGVVPDVATPVLCLAAGLGTGFLLVALARSIRDPVRLVLIGVVLAALYAMLTTVVVLVVPSDRTNLQALLRFTTGSVSGASWSQLATVVPWTAIAIPLGLLTARTLNVLQLGDDVASAVGMRVTRARLAVLGVAVLLVAPVVAVAGPISFVALMSPHVARLLLGTTNASGVLAVAALVGAAVVALADAAGRLLFYPLEIPAGIWTIIVVGPIAVLLARTRIRGAATQAMAG
jgi:iron complex transport system permease protein